ncbi:S1 family peptidase [Mycolicibacterium mengxianglii]|uniref:S1 family peptidase n=1 Tax=Mycolicibacterium mengxianglii TaxID=2736649 RepID=UPI0018EF07F5|nr:serine protease [Mycolicibacterium mengxianglii]
MADSGYEDPTEVIFPIIATRNRMWKKGDSDEPPEFRGTGFLVGDGTLAVTAAHVVDTEKPLWFMIGRELGKLFSLTVLEADFPYDLAILQVDPEFRLGAVKPLRVETEATYHHSLQQMMCVEYSNTVGTPEVFRIAPVIQLGNVTRTFDATDLVGRPAGDDAIEMSFPAPRGASGSPVIRSGPNGPVVVGVVFSNSGSELLPIETSTSLNAANTLLVETKYMVPRALAVNAKKHLVPMLERHQ